MRAHTERTRLLVAAWAFAWLLVALPALAQQTDPSTIPWERIEAWVAGSEAPAVATPQPKELVKETPADVVKDSPKDLARDTPRAELPAKSELPARAEVPAKSELPAKSEGRPKTEVAAKAVGVPPEVDRALRAAGWTSIVGNWKQVERNVYEVTDGRIEAQKANGALNIAIRKGSTGTVSIYVRCPKDHAPAHEGGESAPGYGFVVKGSTFSLYSPTLSEETSGKWYPYKERTGTMVDSFKHIFTMEATTNAKGFTRLTHYIDNKRERTCEYKITTEGVFVVLVQGTAILESPQAVGQ